MRQIRSQMAFQAFILRSLSNQNSLEIQKMKQRSFTSKFTIANLTEYTIEGLHIEHRCYQDEDNPNMVNVTNLKPGRSVQCNWTFDTTAPSITSNIFASVFSFGLSNTKRKWGKDYWLLTMKTTQSSRMLTTNNSHILNFNLTKEGDIWFADIAQTDKDITLSIRYSSKDQMFQVAINRNNPNGQSTRYFRS